MCTDSPLFEEWFLDNIYNILIFQTMSIQSQSNWADGSLLVQRFTPETCEYYIMWVYIILYKHEISFLYVR